MLSQTAAFVYLVRDYMGPAPVNCQPETACGDVVAMLREHEVSSAVITGPDGRLLGILTEQDVCRRLAFSVAPHTPASSVMTSPVHTAREDDYLYHGVADMRRLRLRHMPVVDRRGTPVGILNLHDSLAATASDLVRHIDRLNHDATYAGLSRTKAAQKDVALTMLDDQVPAPDVQWLLSRINMDLHRRVVSLGVEEMKAEGRGDPPVAFDLIVMGSGGRGESFLNPDQDNGFILADCPDSERERVDAWFLELATRMSAALNDLGFDYCIGRVMATNPRWRKTLSAFKRQTREWITEARGDALRYCDIFFDFRHCYGAGDLTSQLRAYVTEQAREPHFLKQLYRIDAKHRGALGMFGRLITDPNEGPNQGKIDLKVAGTLPLVGAVRLFALREGIDDTSTRGRLQGLRRRNLLDDDEADYLSGALRHITRLLMRQQLEDHRLGRPIGNHVPPDVLTTRDKDMLADEFKAIRAFHSRLGKVIGR